MAASGNYKRVPDEDVFIPVVVKRPQANDAMGIEMQKFAEMMQARKGGDG